MEFSKSVWQVFVLLFVSAAFSVSFSSAAKTVEKSSETTTGFMQEIGEERVYHGKPRTGEEVYEYRCKGCHGKNTQGAPMPDDTFEWSSRLSKGIGVLYSNAMTGYNNYLMPPKGGCRNCSAEEVYRAVRYMIERSGLTLPDVAEDK